jgi:hypothetical protein
MNTKLTLRLDADLIHDAKNYAARQGRSVSELVAAYFKRLDEPVLAQQPQPTPPNNVRKSSFYGLLKSNPVKGGDLDETAHLVHLNRKHQ